jgi:predicted DsbA family dithiol-disulfide isomerase
MEAHAQKGSDGFFAYHDLLYENQKALTRADLESYAAQLGLDVDRFRKALDAGTHRAHVEADLEAAKNANVTGTPGFFINDYFSSGAQPERQFERLVERALDEKPKPH